MKYTLFIPLFFVLFFVKICFPQDEYFKGTLIAKLKPEFRLDAEKTLLSHKAVELALHNYELSSVSRIYKQARAPEQEKKYGKRLVDLRLFYQIDFKQDILPDKAIQDLMATGMFEYVQPRFIDRLLYVPDDPSNVSNQYYLERVLAYEAYDSCTGDTSIIIGITDTGADIDHEDLVDNIAYNYNDPINGIDDDNDGFTDNYRGWDLGENDNNPQSNVNDHGVQVSGISSATTDNGIGITGTGFHCRFLPVKIANEEGYLTHSYEGIVYAADHDCAVIVCSWGGANWNPYGQDIIDYATFNRDALVVAAAGNSNNNFLVYPASYDNVISVAATNIDDIRWENSSYGYRVDISAPGESIYFTRDDDDYGYGWGTSYAAPVVAGAAGILKIIYPDFNALQLGSMLINTADLIDTIPENQEYTEMLGKGRLNMYRAITDSVYPYIEMKNIETQENESISITAEVHNYLQETKNLEISAGTESNLIQFINHTYTIGILGTMESVLLPAGSFNFEIIDETEYDASVMIRFLFQDDEYEHFQYFEKVINPSFLEMDHNLIQTTITANSRLGYNRYSQEFGVGFNYKNQGNFLFEGGLILATSTEKVVDHLYDNADIQLEDKVFDVSSESQNYIHYTASFSDENAVDNKIGLHITQHSYAWDTEADEDYVIMEYQIHNKNLFALTNLYAAIFADWDIIDAGSDRASVDSDINLIYAWNVVNPVYYTGIQLLNDVPANAYAIDNVTGGNGGIDIQNGFSREEKYFAMTNMRTEAGSPETGSDIAVVISAGPFEVPANDSIRVGFALLGGENIYNLRNSAESAKQKYETEILYSWYSALDDEIVTLWPNPATNAFSIHMRYGKVIKDVYIYNNLGIEKDFRIINRKENQVEITTQGLSEGIYYLKVTLESDEYVKRVLILR